MMRRMNDDTDTPPRAPSRRLVSLAVVIGISLFAAGFILTITSLSGSSAADGEDGGLPYLGGEELFDSGGQNIVLLLGIALSLVGLVLATAVPAAWFIRSTKTNA